MPIKAVFLVTVVLISTVTSQQSTCDIIEESTALHCLSPLVSYVDIQRSVLHPPLSNVDYLCNQFEKYQLCTAGVRPDCRRSRAPNIELMYEMMCEDKYLQIVREERDCLLQIEREDELKACFVNKTNTLRDEVAANAALDAVKTAQTTSTSYECSVIQSYVDCLLEREAKTCKDAVKIELSLLSLIASREGNDCLLVTNSSRSRPEKPLEECNAHGECTCRLPGYIFDIKQHKCIDIDECLAPLTTACSQACVNLPGSYECTCDTKYYKLAENNKTCVRTDEEPLWLFFAHGQSIWNISTDGKSFQLQRAGLQKTAMLDIDVTERRLYYADIAANAIERMNIDGTFPQAVQRYDVDGLEGIAVDWVARNLYTLRRTDILVQALDGRYRRPLYKNVMKLPRAIALHPHLGQMFVSDWSSNAFIAVASMDGTSFKKIVEERITWPNALAVDLYAEKLYWADAFLDVIEVVNLDGTGRRTIIGDAGSVPHVFGLAVADDDIYWTDWTYRGLLRANKNTGENITVLAQTALLPYSIKVFHPTVQPAGASPSPCLAKNCSQLCLLGPKQTALCACGEGFDLETDGRSCRSNCSDGQIECGGSDPKCISKLYLCDGIAHCANHADEASCPPRICLPGQFQCHDNKRCVSPGGLCDGSKDCPDGSDEAYCPIRPQLP